MTTPAQRHHLHTLMETMVLRAYVVRYPPRDVRTRRASEIQTEAQLYHELNAGTFCFDCSQTAEILNVVAGLKWPAVLRNGATSTMLEHPSILPVYENPAGANVGALVVFGPGGGQHVCQVYKPGKNPTLYSHGADRSSHFISLSEERKYHSEPVRFLSIAKL